MWVEVECTRGGYEVKPDRYAWVGARDWIGSLITSFGAMGKTGFDSWMGR